LAQGDLLVLQYVQDYPGALAATLGTGKPYSTLEMIAIFEQTSGKRILYDLVE
jgi:UDP-glucose 4-epimerase